MWCALAITPWLSPSIEFRQHRPPKPDTQLRGDSNGVRNNCNSAVSPTQTSKLEGIKGMPGSPPMHDCFIMRLRCRSFNYGASPQAALPTGDISRVTRANATDSPKWEDMKTSILLVFMCLFSVYTLLWLFWRLIFVLVKDILMNGFRPTTACEFQL